MSFNEILDEVTERKIKKEIRRECARAERERRKILRHINQLRKLLDAIR